MKVGAAHAWLPIDETYPKDRIVLEFSANSARAISVGTGAIDPNGWLVDENDWRNWRYSHPNDPALDDRRIRRTMRIELSEFLVRWGIETEEGTMDWYEVAVPQGLPFDRGLVMFKTHAYTPEKDDNYDLYTYHWDNLRWDGPVVGRFDVYETDELVYLQANGSREIGETASATINLAGAFDDNGSINNPVLFGQLHSPMAGQVELSINGAQYQVVHPLDYADDEDVGPDCLASGWSSFVLPLDATQLVAAENTFQWRIGPRPVCASLEWLWDGFSVKSLEVQVDR